MFSASLCVAWAQPPSATGKSLPFRNTSHSALAVVAI
jgi:hypothetical protein